MICQGSLRKTISSLLPNCWEHQRGFPGFSVDLCCCHNWWCKIKMRTIRKYSLPPRTLVGNLISDYSRFITSFVITARKHLFCPRLCQEGKQTSRTTDEYSNVSSLPVQLSRCKSLPGKFLGPNRLVVSLRKQLRRTFVFLPVSELFSGSASALSGDTEEQSGAWYSNSFQFQIWTVSFVDNPLKHEGCNLRAQGWKKSVLLTRVVISLWTTLQGKNCFWSSGKELQVHRGWERQ